jgi:hypothetical protein
MVTFDEMLVELGERRVEFRERRYVPRDFVAKLKQVGVLCRSKSHRYWSSGMSVLVDESAEDACAVQSAGVEIVDCWRLMVGLGW